MIFIGYDKTAIEITVVTLIHYAPETLSQEIIDKGILVESIPEPERTQWKNFSLAINPMTGTLSYISTVVKTIEKIREDIIFDMSMTCRDLIINHFYSDCLGVSQRFDCEDSTDQPKIIAYYFSAILMMTQDPTSAMTPSPKLRWKSSGEDFCYAFAPLQVQKLGDDMQAHITEKTDRYHVLKVWVKSQTDIEALEGWTWDMEL